MEKLWLASLLLAGIAYQFDGTTGAGRVIADGPKMRIEFTRGDGVVFKDSSVVITTDGGKTLTLLDPPRKTFMTVNLDQLVGAPVIGKVKLNARDLGAGGTMEGYPTHKWAVDGSYDVTVGDTPLHFTMHSESWRTDRIADEAQFRRGSMMEKLLPPQVKGFPLKEVTTIRAGNAAAATSTTEIHGVRRVSPPPSTFTVPPGYKRK
jgi:Domain of unknown function (DUF4412)